MVDRLSHEAARRGLSLDAFAMQLLDRSLPSQDSRTEVVALLQSWIDDENADEQQATGDYLVRSLDDDRLADRPHFLQELKGITW